LSGAAASIELGIHCAVSANERIRMDELTDAGVVLTTATVGAKTFKAADPDNDGTLTKDEYLALVEKLFNKADVDHDGTLSVQELKSKAARTLKRLIEYLDILGPG